MYEEEEKGDEDDELEDIIEEEEEHNEEESDSEGSIKASGKKKKAKESNDLSKEAKLQQNEEIKNLKTQMLTMKEQLEKKTNKIEEIKTTLKQSTHLNLQK